MAKCLLCEGGAESKPAKIAPFIRAICKMESDKALSCYCNNCDFFFNGVTYDVSSIYKNYRSPEYIDLRDCYEPGFKARADAMKTRPDYLIEVEAWLMKKIPNIMKLRKLDFGSFLGNNTLFKGLTETFDPFTNKQQINPPYDVVFCSHVLEHSFNPLELMRDVFKLSAPGSNIYFEIPLHDGPNERQIWHEHVGFFTENTFRILFHRLQKEFKLKGLTMQNFNADFGKPMPALGVLFTR
jgi:SAM-dependent methyltransferase